MKGICKLCGEEKTLCKQSHIIPNFMYKDLFDKKNQIHKIQSQKGKLEQRGVCQTGEFESSILCLNCDNRILGKLERYASLILYDGNPKVIENRKDPDGTKYTYCAELDYTQFKLFLLSILWRSSISSRPIFQEVNLGPHEKNIRRMLLENDPGDQMEYPCLIMTYRNLDEFPNDAVAQPSQARLNGGYVYKFLISGMIYIYYISKHIIPNHLKDCAINRIGELKIIHLVPQGAKRIFNNMFALNLK